MPDEYQEPSPEGAAGSNAETNGHIEAAAPSPQPEKPAPPADHAAGDASMSQYGIGDDVGRRVTADEMRPQNLDNPIQPIKGASLFSGDQNDIMQRSQPAGYDPNKKIGGPKEVAANPNNTAAAAAAAGNKDWRSTATAAWDNIKKLRNRGKKDEEGNEGDGSGEDKGKDKEKDDKKSSSKNEKVEAAKTAVKGIRAALGDEEAGAELLKQALTDPKEMMKQIKTLQEMTPQGMVMKYKWYIIGAILLLALLLFIAFSGGNFGGLGDKPGDIPFSGNNYSGAYCAEMTDSLISKGQKLYLPNLIGGWSDECKVIDGHCEGSTEPLSTAMRESIPASEQALADENYITYRWPWTAWEWLGHNKSVGYVPNWERLKKEYSGKRIIVFNPELGSNNAFVGIAAESGPGPWTGTPGAKGDTAQRALWETNTKGGYRLDSPPGYLGRLVGGPPKVTAAIHAQQQEATSTIIHPIIVGFLKPDLYGRYPVGQTFTCTRQDRSAPTIIVKPPVPGVKEAFQSLCGRASTMMVVLHYNPAYSDPSRLQRNSDGTYTALGSGDSCVSPSFIDSNSAGKTSNWGYVVSKGKSDQAIIDGIKRSLQNNDPVIVYSNPGMIFDTSEHIFVIVGWDNTKRAFIVNNPNIGSVEVNTATPNGKLMTTDHLLQYLGDRGSSPHYPHAFLMKSGYIP